MNCPHKGERSDSDDAVKGFLTENRIPVGDGSGLSDCCRRCRHRRGCPYAYEQELRRAACQGYADARLLSAEAKRLLELVSQAGDLCGMLELDRGLERVLSQALNSELSLIAALCAQSEISS